MKKKKEMGRKNETLYLGNPMEERMTWAAK